MSTSAIILMVLIQGSVTVITIYFLVKVLRIPPRTDDELSDESQEKSS